MDLLAPQTPFVNPHADLAALNQTLVALREEAKRNVDEPLLREIDACIYANYASMTIMLRGNADEEQLKEGVQGCREGCHAALATIIAQLTNV